MSLLVLNSSSRIAQGIIRSLYNSGKYIFLDKAVIFKIGKYENIVCADLYPSYPAIKSHVDFAYTLKG